MAITVEPKLKVRSMIPVFELTSADGRRVAIWNYKSRRNIVLVFLPVPICRACIDFLQSAGKTCHQYEEEDAVLLAIVQGDVDSATALREKLEPPFPILFDPAGQVTARYTTEVPAVFVADRFGELYAQWIVGPEGTFPSQKKILDVVELINLECPECGAPVEWG